MASQLRLRPIFRLEDKADPIIMDGQLLLTKGVLQ